MKIAIIDPIAGTTEESFARDSAYIRKYLADALEYVLGLCASMGMRTKNCGGSAGCDCQIMDSDF